ncbi:MAG: rhodanese-like domain-containing protein [Actinobacteria bacterium]|nr:rhodanese-like domain-containing protein [Actinomycetota bacterium]
MVRAVDEVTAQEAQRLIEEEGARLIDVREAYEWDEMRIPGAELVPLSEYETDPHLVGDAPLTIFQCASGVRSQTAGDIYAQTHPGAKALNLKGGIGMWAANGLPVKIGPGE